MNRLNYSSFYYITNIWVQFLYVIITNNGTNTHKDAYVQHSLWQVNDFITSNLHEHKRRNMETYLEILRQSMTITAHIFLLLRKYLISVKRLSILLKYLRVIS